MGEDTGTGPAPVPWTRSGEGGDPLLLLHGAWEDRRAWAGMLPLLGSGFDVVAVDRRGHGSLRADRIRARVEEDAEDLASVLTELDLYPAHVAAHGFASSVAVHLALERPELVRSLLLHEPPFLELGGGRSEDGPWRAGVTGALHESCRRLAAGNLEGAVDAYLAEFGSPAETWSAFPPDARECWRANAPAWPQESARPGAFGVPEARLRELGVPVLVSYGEESPAWARSIARATAQCVPHGEAVGLPAAGHLAHWLAGTTLTAVWANYLLERDVPPS